MENNYRVELFFFFAFTQSAVSECDYMCGGSLLRFGDRGTGDAEKLVF